jgi:hypothetical protein
MKLKKCKSCKESFEPTKPLQSVCGWECALQLNRKACEKRFNEGQKVQRAKLKEKVKSLSDYKKDLQYHVNMIVRKIDFGQPCISSGRPYRDNDQAGHFYPTSTQGSIRFNLWNIHSQSVADNMYKSGNNQGYNKGLREVYGDEIYFFIVDLPTIYRDLKLTKDDIIEATKEASAINKSLKKEIRTLEQRIELRKQFNNQINIY